MSIKLMTAAWELRLDPAEKLVLLKLADWVNEERERAVCWPSIAKLAELTNVSDTTVKRAIRALEAAGHVTREYRPGASTKYLVHPGGVKLTGVVHDLGGGSPTTPNTKEKPKTSRAKALSVGARKPKVPYSLNELDTVTAVGWATKNMRWDLSQSNLEFARFQDHAKANDVRHVDWLAAWRNWCRSPFCKTVSVQSSADIRNQPIYLP